MKLESQKEVQDAEEVAKLYEDLKKKEDSIANWLMSGFSRKLLEFQNNHQKQKLEEAQWIMEEEMERNQVTANLEKEWFMVEQKEMKREIIKLKLENNRVRWRNAEVERVNTVDTEWEMLYSPSPNNRSQFFSTNPPP